MTFNMNGNIIDTSYRYTMPNFRVTIGGKGNGIYTIFNNIGDISKKMNHPPEIIFKYIASITGSNYIATRDTITGAHNPDDLRDIILHYMKYLVFCPECRIPETIPQIRGARKHPDLVLCCSACKKESVITCSNKQINKGIDIIIKYLNSGHEWKITKGTMIYKAPISASCSASCSETSVIDEPDSATGLSEEMEAFNPFDSM